MNEVPTILTSDTAYEIEAQALVVTQRQADEGFRVYRHRLRYQYSRWELNQAWYVVNGIHMAAQHSDREFFWNLQEGDKFVEVRTRSPENIITLGTGDYTALAVAAVVLNNGILYQSPYFDLELFKKSNEYFRRSLKWLERPD